MKVLGFFIICSLLIIAILKITTGVSIAILLKWLVPLCIVLSVVALLAEKVKKKQKRFGNMFKKKR